MTLKEFKNEFRLICSDTWGDAMESWFECAGRMYKRNISIPENWKYRPGMGDPCEKDSYFHGLFAKSKNSEKKIFLMSVLCMVSLAGMAPNRQTLLIAPGKRIDPYEKIINAVAMVETHNNPALINKKEGAFGLLQVRKIRLDDYYSKTGKRYELKEMLNPDKAKTVFRYYAKQIGYRNVERICREWNGGENGMRYKQTKVYYLKVRKYL